MATTFIDYTGDGNATKPFSFPSIQESDIKVEVDEVVKSSGTHYNITNYTTTGGGNVVFTSGNEPNSPSRIRIFRQTDVDTAKATYSEHLHAILMSEMLCAFSKTPISVAIIEKLSAKILFGN